MIYYFLSNHSSCVFSKRENLILRFLLLCEYVCCLRQNLLTLVVGFRYQFLWLIISLYDFLSNDFYPNLVGVSSYIEHRTVKLAAHSRRAEASDLS